MLVQLSDGHNRAFVWYVCHNIVTEIRFVVEKLVKLGAFLDLHNLCFLYKQELCVEHAYNVTISQYKDLPYDQFLPKKPICNESCLMEVFIQLNFYSFWIILIVIINEDTLANLLFVGTFQKKKKLYNVLFALLPYFSESHNTISMAFKVGLTGDHCNDEREI